RELGAAEAVAAVRDRVLRREHLLERRRAGGGAPDALAERSEVHGAVAVDLDVVHAPGARVVVVGERPLAAGVLPQTDRGGVRIEDVAARHAGDAADARGRADP